MYLWCKLVVKGNHVRVLMGLLFLWGLVPLSAQMDAAVLDVRSGKVEILRVNTTDWITVAVGAAMPFGAGDRVRTDEKGRVALTFQEDGEVLVLPSSEFFLAEYGRRGSAAGETVTFHAAITGVLVQRWYTTAMDYRLALDDPDTFITSSVYSALWALPELPDSVAVASYVTEVQVRGAAVSIGRGQVAWLAESVALVPLAGTLNTARAQAALFGCTATVDTIGNTGVLVRRGIGQFNERLGLIPDEAPVAAMAINDAGYWVRIQYLSGFSWIIKDALDIDCPDLPRLSDQTPPERLYNILLPTESEIDLLRPFFGSPEEDPFFYRFP